MTWNSTGQHILCKHTGIYPPRQDTHGRAHTRLPPRERPGAAGAEVQPRGHSRQGCALAAQLIDPWRGPVGSSQEMVAPRATCARRAARSGERQAAPCLQESPCRLGPPGPAIQTEARRGLWSSLSLNVQGSPRRPCEQGGRRSWVTQGRGFLLRI